MESLAIFEFQRFRSTVPFEFPLFKQKWKCGLRKSSSIFFVSISGSGKIFGADAAAEMFVNESTSSSYSSLSGKLLPRSRN